MIARLIARRPRNRKLLRLAAIITAIVAVLAAASWANSAHADASQSSISRIAVDAKTTGNTATSLGPTDFCVRVEPGASVVVDVVVDAIPADRPMIAYQFDLLYDPAIVKVTANDPAMLLAANEGFVPVEIGEKPPDSDGDFLVAIVDFSGDSVPEAGPGVLSRVTLSAVGSGVTALSLTEAQVRDNYNEKIPIDELRAANVAVGKKCPSGAPTNTTTPSAGESTPAQGQDQTPGEGTPGTGTPGADIATPSASPVTDGTPGADSGTPASEGTPGASETPGQSETPAAGGGGSDTDNDGDGVGAWIAAPIAAGLLALLAAGYVGFRRLRGRAT